MKITPALEYEKIRQDAESWNKVILHSEGKYMSNGALIRMRRNVRYLPKHNPDKLFRSVNAFLGVLAHHDTFKLRKELLENELTLKFGYFDRDMKVYTLKNT